MERGNGMIVISAPLKADVFQELAIEQGLKFVKKNGMKLYFENPEGNDREKAASLKQLYKNNNQLAAVFFSVAAE